jgi:hypothetical protein
LEAVIATAAADIVMLQREREREKTGKINGQ